VTKYRRKTLSPELLAYPETACGEILAAWRCKLSAFGGKGDRVHVLIDTHPVLDISGLINNLETASARRARKGLPITLRRADASRCFGAAPILSVALGVSHWSRCAPASIRRTLRSTPQVERKGTSTAR